jgi:hypothetical protein
MLLQLTARKPIFTLVALSLSTSAVAQQVFSDPSFDTSVKKPTYGSEHPRVVVDEMHHNLHTIEGRYRPLAELLAHDGYDVIAGKVTLSVEALRDVRVLVIANARGGDNPSTDAQPAFTASECDAVQQWVRGGGALLLIADHAPFGKAASDLALRFGIEMDPGYVFDPENAQGGDPTFLVFSHDNGLLGEHPVIRGRNKSERVHRVVAFTGQSLTIPDGATGLLNFSSSAREVDDYSGIDAALASPDVRPAKGRAQGVAFVFGRGRVIAMGEAAMFSAQVLKSDNPSEPDLRFGMNAPSNDDRQFALNALHWLSRAIP